MSAQLQRLRDALNVALADEPLDAQRVALKLTNPLNGRGVTASRGARMAANAERQRHRSVGECIGFRLVPLNVIVKTPVVVLLTRHSPKKFDDDNLAAAFKSVRDGLAEAWGVNDGSDEVTWLYDWQKSKQHEVEVALWVLR